MRKIIYNLYVFFICSSMIYAQEREIIIIGKTIDSEIGEPIIGVTISEKGVNNGVISDAEGKFSLTH